jgi:hypothetical protein
MDRTKDVRLIISIKYTDKDEVRMGLLFGREIGATNKVEELCSVTDSCMTAKIFE